MTSPILAGLVGAALVGLGLYGLIVSPEPLRKILAFNVMGSGVFLVFGIVARKGAAAGLPSDPVPQAMVITGIVVAFAASAIAVALVLRLFAETGRVTLSPDAWTKPPDSRSWGADQWSGPSRESLRPGALRPSFREAGTVPVVPESHPAAGRPTARRVPPAKAPSFDAFPFPAS